MTWFRQLAHSDIPFVRDDAHRLLPLMIACLIGFAALLLAVAVSIHHTIDSQSQGVIGALQVEVPRSRADDRNLMNGLMQELRTTPGVTDVTIISASAMEGMLKPWLGDNFSLADLSLPVMIDVKTTVRDGHTAVDVEALKRAVSKIDTGIRIEDRGPWTQQVTQATNVLQAIVMVVATLLVACVIGMVVLVAKTNLRLHFKTVSLLHMFGATDDYILRQFQWNSAWLAARGAIAGVLLAGLVFAAVVVASLRWQSPVMPHVSMDILHAVMFVALPVLTAVIAFIVTRMTVRSMLRHMH